MIAYKKRRLHQKYDFYQKIENQKLLQGNFWQSNCNKRKLKKSLNKFHLKLRVHCRYQKKRLDLLDF